MPTSSTPRTCSALAYYCVGYKDSCVDGACSSGFTMAEGGFEEVEYLELGQHCSINTPTQVKRVGKPGKALVVGLCFHYFCSYHK